MTEVIVKSGNKTTQKVARAILREALDRQRRLMQAALLRTQENLRQFETRYQMESACFFALYQSGKLDDRNDYVDWAGEYQILQNIRSHLNCFGELVLCS